VWFKPMYDFCMVERKGLKCESEVSSQSHNGKEGSLIVISLLNDKSLAAWFVAPLKHASTAVYFDPQHNVRHEAPVVLIVFPIRRHHLWLDIFCSTIFNVFATFFLSCIFNTYIYNIFSPSASTRLYVYDNGFSTFLSYLYQRFTTYDKRR